MFSFPVTLADLRATVKSGAPAIDASRAPLMSPHATDVCCVAIGCALTGVQRLTMPMLAMVSPFVIDGTARIKSTSPAAGARASRMTFPT